MKFLIHILVLACLILITASPANAGRRIVGGDEAVVGKYPWMAAMVSAGQAPDDNGWFCGASLIHPEWAVTAAHCVESRTAEDVELMFNIHHRFTDVGDRVGVVSIFNHPEYDPHILDNDIALLRLERELPNAPLAVYSEDSDLTGQMATTMGWGDTTGYDNYSDVLLEVSVPIVSNSTCDDAFSDPITAAMLCAGYAKGGKDACSGDSGGPLFIEVDGALQLAGIVSWGDRCAAPGLYGVYTRISEVRDFIESCVTGLPELTGDINENGRIDTADAIAILQLLASGAPAPVVYEKRADFNQDRVVDIRDVIGILKLLVGIEGERKNG